jgi:hypothetical protein
MQQIADWLKKLVIAEYLQRFVENCQVLPELRIKSTLRAIRELGNTSGTPTASLIIRRSNKAQRQCRVRHGPGGQEACEDDQRHFPGIAGSRASARQHWRHGFAHQDDGDQNAACRCDRSLQRGRKWKYGH